jgi:FMNH2-dependent dimethyl sulfone monooxygenase
MMKRPLARMAGPNKFRLGLFGMNCSNGLCMTTAPEHWDGSWDNNVKAAMMADDAGLDFLLPIGRWHGYKGVTDSQGSTFETITWAAGLLALTQRITISATLHVRFANPIFSAKQMVTADHIGKGRFALNIVSGWNQGEFDMFGVELIPHETRYDFTEEWVEVVKRVWSEDAPFDHDGQHFHLKDVLSKPKPWGREFPLLISAGASTEGRRFAGGHVDCLFTSFDSLEKLVVNVREVRSISREFGREAGVFGSGHMMARPTRKEAEDYYNYIVYEHGDWAAAEHAARIRMKGREDRYTDIEALKRRLISGVGTYLVLGSYDECADHFRKMSEAGLDGIALGLVNYINELPHMQEVMARLERMGLRTPDA